MFLTDIRRVGRRADSLAGNEVVKSRGEEMGKHFYFHLFGDRAG